jgi:hypothetical protein
MKTNELEKDFDCVKMKNDIQAKIYAEIKDMNSNERIAYFKEGVQESSFWTSFSVRHH